MLKETNKKKIILILVFVLNAFVLHLLMYDDMGDDLTVRGLLAPDLLSQLTELWKYNHLWSSRILVNPPIFIMLHLDYHVWILCDVLMLYLIFRGIMYLLHITDTENLTLFVLVMLLYPLDASINYGNIVMSITYIWPAAAAVWSLAFIRMHREGQRARWYHCILFVLFNIYASNKEELSVTLFLIFFAYAVYSVVKKSISHLAIVQAAVSLASIFFHMFYTGNHLRFEELSEGIPYTIIDKAEIGITSTFFGLLCRFDFITFVFFVLMAICIWQKHAKRVLRFATTLLPILLTVLSIAFFKHPKSVRDTDYAISYGKYSDSIEWFKLVIYILCAALILWEVYLVFSENRTYINMWLLLLAGFGGRCVVGFGNKGWLTSFERTYTFLYLIMLYIIYHLIIIIYEDLSSKNRKILVRVLIALAVYSDLRIIYVLWW